MPQIPTWYFTDDLSNFSLAVHDVADVVDVLDELASRSLYQVSMVGMQPRYIMVWFSDISSVFIDLIVEFGLRVTLLSNWGSLKKFGIDKQEVIVTIPGLKFTAQTSTANCFIFVSVLIG